MEIVPEEAKVVRWIYYMFLEGISPTAIATILTTATVPSPAGGDQWWPKTVMSILTNEKYYGAARLQKTYIADHITRTFVTIFRLCISFQKSMSRNYFRLMVF